MEIDAIANPVGAAIVPGELLLMRRGTTPILMIALPADRHGQWMAVLNMPGAEAYQFTRKVLQRESDWASFGTDWLLELRPGPELGKRRSELIEQPGVISHSTSAGAFLAVQSSQYERIYISLSDWTSELEVDYDGLVYPDWAIWRSAAHKTLPGSRPIYESTKGYLLP